MALAEIGAPAHLASAALASMLRVDRENLRGRAWCAEALVKVGAEADLAVPALLEALGDPSEEVRSVAVLSLEHYGPEAADRGALQALIDTLHDPHWKVRGNAACALPKMGPDPDLAALVTTPLEIAARDDSDYVSNCATRALGELKDLAAAPAP
jgi:HEAT repeat protein